MILSSKVEVVFNPTENFVARIGEDHIITIENCSAENGVGKAHCELEWHREEITYMGWVDSTSLLSADVTGKVIISSVDDKSILREITFSQHKMENLYALSPSGKTLFVGGIFSSDGKVNEEAPRRIARYSTSDFQYMDDIELFVKSSMRFFAAEENILRCWHLKKLDNVISEHIQKLDFSNKTNETLIIPGGPKGIVSHRYSPCDIQQNKIARICFEDPVLCYEDESKELKVDAFLEVRNLDANECETRLSAFTLTARDEFSDRQIDLLKGSVQIDEDSYRQLITQNLFSTLNYLKFTSDASQLWISLKGGALRLLDVANEKRSALIVHRDSQKAQSIDDVFNNYPLCVSPSGKCLAFDKPLQVLFPATLPLFSEKIIEVSHHTLSQNPPEKVTCSPENIVLESGWLLTTTDDEILLWKNENIPVHILSVPNANQLRLLALSPDGNSLLVGSDGIKTMLFHGLNQLDNEVQKMKFPFLGHTISGGFLSNEKMYWVTSKASVVQYDFQKAQLWDVSEPDAFAEMNYPFEKYGVALSDSVTEPDDIDGFFEDIAPSYDFDESEEYLVFGCAQDPQKKNHIMCTCENGSVISLRTQWGQVKVTKQNIFSTDHEISISGDGIALQAHKGTQIDYARKPQNDDSLNSVECLPGAHFVMINSGGELLFVDERHSLVEVNAQTESKVVRYTSPQIISNLDLTDAGQKIVITLKDGCIEILDTLNFKVQESFYLNKASQGYVKD